MLVPGRFLRGNDTHERAVWTTGLPQACRFKSYSGNQIELELDLHLLPVSPGGINGRVAAARPAGWLAAIAIAPPPPSPLERRGQHKASWSLTPCQALPS